MRQPSVARLGAVQVNALDGLANALEQAHLQLGCLRGALAKRGGGVFRGDTGTGDCGYVFCSRAKLVFLHAAVDEVLHSRAPFFVKHAHAFRPVESVRRQGQQISAELLHVRRQPAAAGGGIDEQRDTAFGGELGHLGDRLYRAKVEVCVLQANEDCLVGHRAPKRIGIDPALAIDADSCAAEALALKPGDGANHSRMLDLGGDDVAAEPAVGQGGALDRVVDRLGAAGG